jgi:hypothetical protein
MGLLDILTQAAGRSDSGQHFGQVAQDVPPNVLSKGLSAAFSSNQTPSMGSMTAQLFGQSSGGQQAGMLNRLMSSLGPSVMTGLGGGILGKIMSPGQTQITPEQAQQLSPQQVQQVVDHASDVHPGVADQLGSFYAEHKGLLNTIGGVAATVALAKMKNHLEAS